MALNPFYGTASFQCPLKKKETSGFLIFSESIEKD